MGCSSVREGTGLVSGVSYRAVELSGTLVNHLPPPGTGTFFSTVTTLLIPQGSAAPSMLLVVVVSVFWLAMFGVSFMDPHPKTRRVTMPHRVNDNS